MIGKVAKPGKARIARRTGVPQPKVYQALDSLVEKGFCAVGADVGLLARGAEALRAKFA